jgi:hypothetical protein
METINQNSEQYQYARKQVKSLKGFYIHLTIYILLNLMIIFASFYDKSSGNENIWRFETFATAIFWGIGLIAHGVSVFGKNLIFNKEWEEKKIQEFMNKDKKSTWE